MAHDDASHSVDGSDRSDAALTHGLAQLTSGWAPLADAGPESLAAARTALAATLIAGRTAGQLRASHLPARFASAVAVDPPLHAELQRIVHAARHAPRATTLAVVRSATAAHVHNPLGTTAWARAGRVVRSFGPFRDAHGGLHWVDLLPLARSTPVAFGSSAAPFGVFPVRRRIGPHPRPVRLELDAGSAWFLATQIVADQGLAPDTFTGFAITGGELIASAPMTLTNGVYVVPFDETLTATFSLASAPVPAGTGGSGADAVAARFDPPATVTIEFSQNSVVFTRVDDCRATAYGTQLDLHWTPGPALVVKDLATLLIPCAPTPQAFTFASVASALMQPAGTAPVRLAGWGLPLVQATVATLPEAARPGSALVDLRAGATVAATPVMPQRSAVSHATLDIETGRLFVLLLGKAKPATTTYELWPLAAPSTRNASLEFTTHAQYLLAFVATPGEEMLLTGGAAKAHLDRPRTATGDVLPFAAQGLLALTHTDLEDRLVLAAWQSDAPSPIFPLALSNCALGIDAPEALVVTGRVRQQALLDAAIGVFYNLRWLLPTLPDPYAANFDLTAIPAEPPATIGALVAVIDWAGDGFAPTLGFVWLPPLQGGTVAATPFPPSASIGGGPSIEQTANPALLDLSTRVDLLGVAFVPVMGAIALSANGGGQPGGTVHTAPAIALDGMALALNSGLVATFALPQSSWEPMESTVDPAGPIYCDPPSDGPPLLVSAPDVQRLVPFSPEPMLTSTIDNVAAGQPFAALLSLPFGLKALIIEPNQRVDANADGVTSSFLKAGGAFQENRPQFAAPALAGARTLMLKPPHPDFAASMFKGVTDPDADHGPRHGPGRNGYGYTVLGANHVDDQGKPVTGIGEMFHNAFFDGKLRGVPLRRIDLSGYGASIFSDWTWNALTTGIAKVAFEQSLGRTGLEVVQVVSVIYPYCVRVVRTITMQRRNAGWVQRTDSGWQPLSSGQFDFPNAPAWQDRVHKGALAGVFNVRNIREQDRSIHVDEFEFRKVLFDADLGVDPALDVISGGFNAPVQGVPNPPVLVASRDLVGWLQMAPAGPNAGTPDPAKLLGLFEQSGALTPAIHCTIDVGRANGLPGTTLRCSAFEVGMAVRLTEPAEPALGVALRGSPQIPRGGGWSLARRGFADPAPSALPAEFALPLVQPAGAAGTWYFADVTDLLRLDQPDSFYSLMHGTGTQKVLFESPQIQVGAAKPGLQFPKPGPARPDGVPANAGSPNLGDLASILNSSGLFPDIGNAVSLIGAALEQIDTTAQGFKYSKSVTLGPNRFATLADLPEVAKVTLQYADVGSSEVTAGRVAPQPAQLTYTVDSAASPSWSLRIGPLSFLVTLPLFGSDPVLMLTGSFYADEHTKAGLTGLNVQMGGALGIVKQVFSALQTVAQFLPGGASSQLDVGLSNGKLTVRESFTVARLPLGLGTLTDISLDLGLAVGLQPLAVDFSLGIGNPKHPFNWIVSPLAGNGLMEFGLRDSMPALTIQAGIGVGLAIDLGIASGSASVTIAFRLDVTGKTLTLMALLSGQASVDVLDGLASATVTLTAALGFSLRPPVPQIHFQPDLPFATQVTIDSEEVTLIALCSVGIHISVCWVVNVDWDGSWEFKQTVHTPQLTVGI